MEVGKKYKFQRRSAKETIYRAIWKTPEGNIVLSYRDDDIVNEVVIRKDGFKYYEEYIEPEKGAGWINVYRQNGRISYGNIHPTKQQAIRLAAEHGEKNLIATVEFKWTEGEGL